MNISNAIIFNQIFDSLKDDPTATPRVFDREGVEGVRVFNYQTSENHSYKTISQVEEGEVEWVVVLDKTSKSVWSSRCGEFGEFHA